MREATIILASYNPIFGVTTVRPVRDSIVSLQLTLILVLIRAVVPPEVVILLVPP